MAEASATPAAADAAEEAQPSTTAMLMQMKSLMEGLPTQMVEVRSNIGDVKKDLSDRINEGTAATEELKKRMDHNDNTFADRVAAVVRGLGGDDQWGGIPVLSSAGQSGPVRTYASCFSSAASSTSASDSSGNSSSISGPASGRMSQEDIYWQCRRSLRLWPVPGKDGPEISKSLRIYLRDHLHFSSAFLTDMGETSIKRIPTAPGARIKDEVVVIFSSTEVRDAIRRGARELAGSPEAGIRLEVPRGLQPSLKALEAVSYSLKQKNSNIRRSIKFDNASLDLVLDFNTDPDGSGVWRRVTAAQAKQMRGKIGRPAGGAAHITDAELEGMMDTAAT